MMGKAVSRRMIVLLATTILTAVSGNGVAYRAAFAQAAQVYRFNIPAKPIRQAMNDIVSVSGIDVVFSETSAASTVGKPVSGALTPSQAVAALLSGTELSYRFTSSNTVTIFDARQAIADGGVADGSTVLETITVQGANPNSSMTLLEAYAGGQVATGGQVGMLGNRTVMNTPFNQTSYTNKTIQDQQAQTIQDVTSNDPSVITFNKRNSILDWTNIRGFGGLSNTGGKTLNGMPGLVPLTTASTDMTERVEILKGPSALLNGMAAGGSGGVGGTINLVTKQAGDEPLTQLTTSYTSRSQLGTHLDVGRRFGTNKEFGIRVNGSIRKGDTPFDTQWAKQGFSSVNLDYRGERVRLSADLLHQENDGNVLTPQVVLRSVTSILRPPKAGTMLWPAWGDYNYRSTTGMVRGEVDIADNVTAYAAIGAQKYDRYASGGVVTPTVLDNTGRFSYTPGISRSYTDVLSVQAGVRATADTGPIHHALSLNYTRSEVETGSSTWAGSTELGGTIYNPIFGPSPLLVDPGPARKASKNVGSSFGIADTMSAFDERIQLTAGLRFQQTELTNFNTTTGLASSNYSENALTPAVGLIVKPWENVSLYANYIEDLQTGIIVPAGYVNAGAALPPYRSKQYEAGIKVDWGAITTTASVFQIGQPAIMISTGAGGSSISADGEQVNRGVELNAYGEVKDGVRLLGGVTLLDARITKTASGLYDGNRADGAPVFRAVAGAEWDTPFLEGLTLTGRATYTGKQEIYASAGGGREIPAWTTLDLGARYTFDSPWNSKPVTIRFNVDNVFNRSYWATGYSGLAIQGEARTFRLSAAFNF